MVRGEDEEDSVAITTSMGEGGGEAAGLKKEADAQLIEREIIRKRRRTSVSAMTLPQSAGRTGCGDIREKLQKYTNEDPAAAETIEAETKASASDAADTKAREEGRRGEAWRLCIM